MCFCFCCCCYHVLRIVSFPLITKYLFIAKPCGWGNAALLCGEEGLTAHRRSCCSFCRVQNGGECQTLHPFLLCCPQSCRRQGKVHFVFFKEWSEDSVSQVQLRMQDSLPAPIETRGPVRFNTLLYMGVV